MKIGFDKVKHSQKPFELTIEDINFKGTLLKRDHHRVRLEGYLFGMVDLICDRCGVEYRESIDSSINLTLNDGIVETRDDLDIIEFVDGIIDLDFILQSEIASIKNSYHQCKDCQDDVGEFEKEF